MSPSSFGNTLFVKIEYSDNESDASTPKTVPLIERLPKKINTRQQFTYLDCFDIHPINFLDLHLNKTQIQLKRKRIHIFSKSSLPILSK